MSEQNFAVFESVIGPCAAVWTPHGIAGVQLPERDEQATRARVRRRFPAATEATPPPPVQDAIDGMIALLAGEPRDLSDIVIDDSETPEFNRRVYAIARAI